MLFRSWGYWTIGSDNLSTGGYAVSDTNIGEASQLLANITVGQLTYNFTVSKNSTGGNSLAVNSTTLYVTDPEAAAHANIDNPGLIMFEGKDDQNVYEVIVVDLEGNAASMGTSTNGIGVFDTLFSSTRYHPTEISLASDSDHSKDVDMWGVIALTDADDSDQKILDISYPESQVYAKIYIGETAAFDSASGGLGNVLVLDSEVASVATKNLIVVGGSCVNTAAAALVGGAYCEADWTTATSAGTGQYVVKAYATSSITSKLALLVAGYEAADTTAAATYVTTTEFDTSTANVLGPATTA